MLAAYIIALMLVSNVPSACYCIGAVHGLEEYKPYDIVIVDPDEFPESMIEELHSMGKIVLAYINVGYAEDWRWYWSRLESSSIIHEWAGYEGEYFVEFWDPLWIETIVNYSLGVLELGYDGVYLDNVDAAIIIGEMKPPWALGVDPATSMISVLGYISEVIHDRSGLVYINIGAATSLLYNKSLLNAVDGVLREEAFFHIEGECSNMFNSIGESIEVVLSLEYAKLMGKRVIAVEFVDSRVEAAVVGWFYRLLGITPVMQPACDPDYLRPPYPPLPYILV